MFQNKNESAVRINTLFRGVSNANLYFKFNPKNFVEIGEGEIIYKSGDTSDCLYLIIEGEIKLKITGGISSPLIIGKSNNDFFGEKELQENSVRKSSAVANKNSLLYIIKKSDLNIMTQKSQDLRVNLLGDVKNENSTETNKKETVFDGLIEKMSEQTFFQSEDNKSTDSPNKSETDIPTIKEEETNNISETGFDNYLPDESEPKIDSQVILEKDPESKNMEQIPIFYLINALQKIFFNLNPEEIFTSIPESISGLLKPGSIVLYLINNESDELRTYRKTETGFADFSLKIKGNIFLESIKDGNIINLIHPSKEQLVLVNHSTDTETEVNDLLIYPIKNNNDKVIGILQLINNIKGAFNSEDEKLMGELSPLVALAIENSTYVKDLLYSDRLASLNKAANFLLQNIKNPIITIRQYSEHIKKQNLNKEINLIIDMIVEQGNCVLDLVQTTLGFSEDKSNSNPQPILLTNVLNYILSMLAGYVESRNVKLFKKFEGDGLVNIDKKEFYQACLQIANNACDAMPQGGNLYITTTKKGDKIHIEFRDNGFGISDSIKGRIFEPFVTSGDKEKSGLGLAIAKKIINEQNGIIRSESNLGEGAILIIELPVLE